MIYSDNRHITVYGSYIQHVAPNLASLKFYISENSKQAKTALSEAKKASADIQAYLSKMQMTDISVSQVKLQQTSGSGYSSRSNKRSDSYIASFSFHVILHELNKFEDVWLGLDEAGAINIQVSFQSNVLKELREQTRRQAIEVARNKAMVYCDAASIQLGKIISIADQNPDSLVHAQHERGHTPMPLDSAYLDEPEIVQASNPSSIILASVVKVMFQIE